MHVSTTSTWAQITCPALTSLCQQFTYVTFGLIKKLYLINNQNVNKKKSKTGRPQTADMTCANVFTTKKAAFGRQFQRILAKFIDRTFQSRPVFFRTLNDKTYEKDRCHFPAYNIRRNVSYKEGEVYANAP